MVEDRSVVGVRIAALAAVIPTEVVEATADLAAGVTPAVAEATVVDIAESFSAANGSLLLRAVSHSSCAQILLPEYVFAIHGCHRFFQLDFCVDSLTN
jgi:hypothetical protein